METFATTTSPRRGPRTSPPAQLLVCNASGVPVYRTVSGDVTITNAGVTAIGTGKVVTANLANDAVTAAKLDLLDVVAAQASGQTSLTTSYQSMVTITSPAAGTYLFLASATFVSTSASVDVFLRFDDDTNPRAEDWVEVANSPVSQTIFYTRTVNGTEDVSLQAKTDTNPAGTVKNAQGIETRVLGVRIG
jgi:hypothetical protein